VRVDRALDVAYFSWFEAHEAFGGLEPGPGVHIGPGVTYAVIQGVPPLYFHDGGALLPCGGGD